MEDFLANRVWLPESMINCGVSAAVSCLLEHGLPQDFCPSNWLLTAYHESGMCEPNNWGPYGMDLYLLYGSYDRMNP